MEYYEADFEVIAPDIDQDWNYSAEVNDNCIPLFFMSTSDENAPSASNPGEGNAYEDAYKALLEEEGIVVDDSDYDSDGYNVYNDDDVLLFNFYSWNGVFNLSVFCPKDISNVVSQGILDYFFYNAFLMEDVELPFPEVNDDWGYFVDFVDGSGSYLDIYTVDLAAPNSDTPSTGEAIEDDYKAILEEAGWVVDDTYYDSTGYYATCDELPLELLFYSWNDQFCISIMFDTSLFPVDFLATYLAEMGADEDVVIPTPESEDYWYWGFSVDNDGDPYFYAYTDDEGTPGEDAIEDTYRAVLNGDDWDIDDSAYETAGYIATLGNVKITFYSYDGEFNMYVETFEPEEPEEPEEPQNPGE